MHRKKNKKPGNQPGSISHTLNIRSEYPLNFLDPFDNKTAPGSTRHFYHAKTGILLRYLIVHFIYHKVQCHLHHLNDHPFTCTTMTGKIISATLWNEIERTAFPFNKSLRMKYSRIIPSLGIMVCSI